MAAYRVQLLNLSGRLPDPEDFEGLRGKSDAERREMGLAPREDAVLGGLDATEFVPHVSVVLADGMAVWVRRRVGVVCRVVVVSECLAWWTHVMVQDIASEAVFIEALAEPRAVLPGARVQYAFTAEDVGGRLVRLTCALEEVGRRYRGVEPEAVAPHAEGRRRITFEDS